MDIQLIRNATVKIKFGEKTWLVDPFLGDMGSLPPFAGKSPNPVVPLPVPISEILEDVDYVLLTHLHPDHFDERARQAVPTSVPFVVQPADAEAIKEMGFSKINVIDQEDQLGMVKISRVGAQHGDGEILKVMGAVSGYILETRDEPPLYITGDTVWCDSVKETLDRYNPGVVICNAGGNVFLPEDNPFREQISLKHIHQVIMDEKQVLKLLTYREQISVVAVHIGALDHETVSRKSLKEYLRTSGIDMRQVYVPEDGEMIKLN
ncbi:MBL fold metallo-hydrolase [Prolixibacter sp. NT017]|uniref:MBL fold metallo-hydrolase n=1 Tax=Prolixibacter sp. NT017 TaxID=2652390 RepID=UPI0012759190|nr:MBL fold metallo-hydrolase [Prolixibacter sp. NT017]GET25555.1 hypothetical protein NT017_18840 [Prolixibacter sp. NT017]